MPNMPQRTIYIRQADTELWEWAKAKAARERTTISGILMNALDEYRQRLEGKEEDHD